MSRPWRDPGRGLPFDQRGLGRFLFLESQNENRAKYAQRFLKQFADKYGADVAVRVAEIVLKD